MKAMSAVRRKEMLEGYLLISPWFIGLILFTVAPVLFALYISFTSYDVIGKWPPDGVGLGNYSKLFTRDHFFVHSLWNTLYYAVGSTLVGLSVGLALALLLNQKLKGTTILRTLYYIPGILPAVGMTLVFVFIFDPGFGIINQLLETTGIVSQANPPGWLKNDRMSMPTVISWSIWGMGGSMLVFLAGLQGVPSSLYEAARIDGAGKLKEFLTITLPMITPTIFFNLIVGLIGAFQEVTKFYVANGGTGTGPNVDHDDLLYLSAGLDLPADGLRRRRVMDLVCGHPHLHDDPDQGLHTVGVLPRGEEIGSCKHRYPVGRRARPPSRAAAKGSALAG